MTTIYKYPLYLLPFEHDIKINAGARILKVGRDPRGIPCIWALVDTDAPEHRFKVMAVGTGWALDKVMTVDGVEIGGNNFMMNPAYIDSIIEGDYVWHIFIYDTESRKDENC